jgi:hypothetical protein
MLFSRRGCPTLASAHPPAVLPQYAHSAPGQFGRPRLRDGQVGIDEVAAPSPGAAGEPPPHQPGGGMQAGWSKILAFFQGATEFLDGVSS